MSLVDLKLIFVVVFILAMCYETNVNCFSDDYTAFASQRYDVGQRELYEFVTTPQLVDRWMDWLPFFMAADYKPLGIGKHFLVFSSTFEYLLKVTDYEEGKYLALESDLLLRPRVELIFSKSTRNESSELEIRMSFRRTSALFQHTVGWLYRKVIQPKLVQSLHFLRLILDGLPKTRYMLDDEDLFLESDLDLVLSPELLDLFCNGI